MSDKDQITPRGADVIIASIITVIIASFVVGLRLITRVRILKFVGSEDWCIVGALLFSIADTVGMVFQARYALGQHMSVLSPRQIELFLKACYGTMMAYNISLTLSKMSILLLYRRIFPTGRRMEIACYVYLGVITACGVWATCSVAFACNPISFFWNKSIKGSCLPNTPIWFLNAGLNIATDLSIFILPLPVLRTLGLPRKQKIGLYFVFTLGLFVCIISITRLHALLIAGKSTDPTWDNVGIATWSCVELNMAIVCPSLPVLKPLIARLFPRILLNSTYTKDEQSTGQDGFNTHNKFDTLNESFSIGSMPTTGAADDLEAFEVVQLEGGLVRMAPKKNGLENPS